MVLKMLYSIKGPKTRLQQSSISKKEGTSLFPSPEQHLFETMFTGIERADSKWFI